MLDAIADSTQSAVDLTLKMTGEAFRSLRALFKG